MIVFLFFVLALFDMSRETDVNITLYSRKVMIMSKANNILPKWMRFMKGKSVLSAAPKQRGKFVMTGIQPPVF